MQILCDIPSIPKYYAYVERLFLPYCRHKRASSLFLLTSQAAHESCVNFCIGKEKKEGKQETKGKDGHVQEPANLYHFSPCTRIIDIIPNCGDVDKGNMEKKVYLMSMSSKPRGGSIKSK